MARLKDIFNKLSKELKFSASDPRNFDEVWSFQSTSVRLLSLIALYSFLVVLLTVVLFVYGPFSGYFSTNDVDINRNDLEEQSVKISVLKKKLETQDKFISNITKLLHGEELDSMTVDEILEMPIIEYDSLNVNLTDAEQDLVNKINDDIRMNRIADEHIAIFGSPVTGTVSQEFDKRTHPGIDIVTAAGTEVKACLGGTIIYAGFTRKDGYILVIDHGNGFLSLYKHNKTIFKKIGDKVQLGDPIAIVGNTGENTTGPHLHFELWHNQKMVDPAEYIDFKK